MNDFVIITDSCCDLPAKLADELELTVMPLSVLLKGEEFKNYLDEREITFSDFYAEIRAGHQATTSAVNADAFMNVFESVLVQGKDILSISFSSALSSTYHFSTVAASELAEKYPQRKIITVDSLCASLGQGLLLYLAVAYKRQGKSLDEVHAFVEEKKHQLCHWFTVDDLNHLRRGGRISRATAVLGVMLSIRPILHCDTEGRLTGFSKSRGRRKSLEELVNHMQKTVIDSKSQTVFISHADCIEDAKLTAELVRARMEVKDIIINSVGPVIGAHCGPGTVALFFLGTER